MQLSLDALRLRAATLDDAPSIARLLATLGYPASVETVRSHGDV